MLTHLSALWHLCASRRKSRSAVVSPGGWHASVRIKQIERTPGGTERVLRSESYRFKQGAPNETDDQRKLRLGVKRDAKRRAKDKFHPERMEQKSGRSAVSVALRWRACRRLQALCHQQLSLTQRHTHSVGIGYCLCSNRRSC